MKFCFGDLNVCHLNHLTSNYVTDYDQGIQFLRLNPMLNFSRKFELLLEHLTMSLLPVALISEPEGTPLKTLNCFSTRSPSQIYRSQSDSSAI